MAHTYTASSINITENEEKYIKDKFKFFYSSDKNLRGSKGLFINEKLTKIKKFWVRDTGDVFFEIRFVLDYYSNKKFIDHIGQGYDLFKVVENDYNFMFQELINGSFKLIEKEELKNGNM